MILAVDHLTSLKEFQFLVHLVVDAKDRCYQCTEKSSFPTMSGGMQFRDAVSDVHPPSLEAVKHLGKLSELRRLTVVLVLPLIQEREEVLPDGIDVAVVVFEFREGKIDLETESSSFHLALTDLLDVEARLWFHERDGQAGPQ